MNEVTYIDKTRIEETFQKIALLEDTLPKTEKDIN